MSKWIRIDNDTYIDDSLMTCAEYQLFIDEMRAQEKYHQPDHWTGYHFSKGHARQPILGMRPSDAVAFCKWLTRCNNDGWTYRLPTTFEAQEISVAKAYTPPIGYWLAKNAEQNFAWVGQTPKNPRNLANDLILDRARVHNRTFDVDGTRALARIRASARAFARASSLALDLDLELARARAIANTTEGALARARILASDLELGFVAIANTRTLGLARAIASDLERAAVHASDQASDLERTLVIAINIYADIFTIQARIAGTSPAFEGIRLVREHDK
ncbi:MAG: SUMF1/EgtB/PvdO family nonheme iron enzyme [Anaerolineales bacterium]|jgi:hypothetical protein|nr:SUMF1/EgtB/PvdO family nonheme iron enzyme [Anaerolineales bacterium]